MAKKKFNFSLEEQQKELEGIQENKQDNAQEVESTQTVANTEQSENVTQGITQDDVQRIAQLFAQLMTQDDKSIKEAFSRGAHETVNDTQGNRTGTKRKRINLAFTDANYKYVTLQAQYKGISTTQFINNIIEDYRNTHKWK